MKTLSKRKLEWLYKYQADFRTRNITEDKNKHYMLIKKEKNRKYICMQLKSLNIYEAKTNSL